MASPTEADARSGAVHQVPFARRVAIHWRSIFSGLVIVSALPVNGATARADSPEITHIADLRALSRRETEQAPPVRAKGIVILRGGANSWVVQDESAGTWVSADVALRRGLWQGDLAVAAEVKVGSLVEIEGVADPGGFAPFLLPRRIRLLGHGELPAAQELPLAALISGGHDFRLVAAEGLVIESRASGEDRVLRLDSEKGSFLAEVRVSPALAGKLVGAEVRITGIAGSTYNSRSEFVSLRMTAHGDENVRILKAAPADPFDVPKVPLGELASFSPTGRPLRRQKVEGAVTFCSPGSHFYLQDGQTAIRVSTASEEVLRPGDRVEASGFVDRARIVAGMVGAVIRKTGEGAAPEPVRMDWPALARVFEPLRRGLRASPHDYDGWLLQTEGELVQIHHLPGGETRLILSTVGHNDSALLPPLESEEDRRTRDALRPGSVLRVTGVAEFDYAKAPGRSIESVMPVGLNLQMRDLRDVTVLQPAPWWTPQRIYWALGLFVMVIAAAGLWIFILQRMVARQARRLEETLRTHHDSELEMKGAREERYRLAADLHDGLQQHLTGATYRMEAALMRLGELPPSVQEQFDAARAALERTRSGLRECLVGLRHVEEGPAEFPALLGHAAGKMEHWPKGAVEIITTGEPFPLSRNVMGSLLLFMQEAVANAFRHGTARHVQVRLHYRPETLELRVEDDGSGFDAAKAPDASSGHFGLESMRHRLRWLGGAMEIDSQPGEGTRITGRLARKRAEGESRQPTAQPEGVP